MYAIIYFQSFPPLIYISASFSQSSNVIFQFGEYALINTNIELPIYLDISITRHFSILNFCFKNICEFFFHHKSSIKHFYCIFNFSNFTMLKIISKIIDSPGYWRYPKARLNILSLALSSPYGAASVTPM